MSFFCRARTNLALTAGVVAVFLSTAASAQSLSEKLTRQLGEAQRSENEQNYDRALAIYAEALGIRPEGQNLRRVLKMRARLFEQLEDFAKAESDLSAALAIEPLDPTLYLDRGYFYLRRQRYDEASADFAAGARREPKNAAYLFAEGRVETGRGQHAEAIERYTRAVERDPGFARALLGRAEARVHLGQIEAAQQDYEKTLALTLSTPQDRFFALLGRGYVALALGDFTTAIARLTKALTIDPSSYQALAWRGYAYERRGERDRAIADYEQAAAFDPANPAMHASVRRLRSE